MRSVKLRHYLAASQVRVQEDDDESDRGTYDGELIWHSARRLQRDGAQGQAFYAV